MPQLVEKYRPTTPDQIKGQDHVIKPLQEMLKRSRELGEKPPNLLLMGLPGTGKTTTALWFAEEYLDHNLVKGYNFFELNGSDERKLTDIRDRIKPLTQLVTKIVIFVSEADGLIAPAQEALRRMSETTKNALFIFDLNNQTKFIEAMKSRTAEFRFKPLTEEVVIQRLIDICQAEGIQLKWTPEEEAGFSQIYKISKGDLRKAINELEKIITSNKEINAKNIIESIKVNVVNDSLKNALGGDFIKAKNLMEDAYITSGNNTDLILDALTESISQVQDDQIQVRLYYELGELDHRLQSTRRPLIALTSFISFCYILPHIKKGGEQ